jgi:translocation and assembly module TamB
MDNPTHPRRIRRRWKVLAGVLIVVLIGLAALPWLLSTGLARSTISDGINRAFAPGRVEFESIELGWFSSTRLNKAVLLDPKDKVVARVPVAVLDRTLSDLIFARHSPVLLSLDSTELEVERSSTGTIDLAEALKTIVSNPDPKRDLTIRIDRGTLTYRDPFLAESSTADTVNLTLRIPTAPNPVSWKLDLAQGGSTLEAQGDFDRWLSRGGTASSPELHFDVVARQWPFVARAVEVDAQGKLDGTLDFARKRGRWGVSGDARLNGLKADGKPLLGDTLTVEKLEAGWDLVQEVRGWTIRRLALNCPLGDLKAEGQIEAANGTGKQKIDAKVDLAAIARQLPHALRLRDGLSVERGSARISLDLTSDEGGATYEVEARLSDLEAKDHGRTLTLRDPASLTGRVIRKGKDSSVERLAIKTSFLDAQAKGRFQDGVEIEARIDLAGLRRQIGEWVDLGGLELAGNLDVSGTYRVQPVGTIVADEDRVSRTNAEGIPQSPSSKGRLDSPRFLNRMKAAGRDLRIGRFAFDPLRRDSVALEVAVNGPTDASGWPQGWQEAFLNLKADATEARLWLEPDQGWTPFSATLQTPISADNRVPMASLLLSGKMMDDRRNFTFERIQFGSSANREAIQSKGSLNLSSGELVIENDPALPSKVIKISSDGLRISGLGKGLAALRFEGGLSGDAEALDRLTANLAGRSPIGLSGRWSALASARGDGDGVQFAAKVGLDDLQSLDKKPTRPTSLALSAHYSPKLDRVAVSEFAVSTAYGTLDASGTFDEPLKARKVDLNGKLSPDFAAITALLVEKVEKGAKIEGRPRGFHAIGSIAESSGGWKGLDAEFGFDLLGADIYGMKFGASPVVLRAKDGKLTFDPISTSINEGHIRLEPELDLDSPKGPTLRLAKNSNIREARINDEVSKRVLAFVAPVLDQSTRASGLVSVDLDHAEFPIGTGRGRQAVVEGAVVFQDVEFAPGPLAGEILGVIGRRDLTLKLDQPVTLTIADGRINQRGMAIPIADFTRIELSGWVDFDRKIALVATVPVTSAMLGNNPLLSDIAAGTRVTLPIGGTLDRPKIDKEAFSKNLQDLAKTLLTRGATRGAMELLFRLAKPRNPDAPPPPPRMTPDERKAQRQEKKAIRRGEIPQSNP